MKNNYFLFFLSALSLNAGAQDCSDLFISEYEEGSSYNKAIEIFNPTSGTVDLSNYRLLVFFNGVDTAQGIFKLHGSVASNSVWVGCHGSADSLIKSVADTTSSFVINWNGNDAVALVNTATSDTVDIIGEIGVDPGSDGWVVGAGTTRDHTLVRHADVQQGTTVWSESAFQWTVYDQNDFSNLGSHTMTPCDITSPSVFFTSDTMFVSEGAGTFTVKVGIINPNVNATPVDVSVTGGTADEGSDYSLTSPQTVTFPSNSSDPVSVTGTLVSDGIVESDETITLALTNAGNGATITAGAMKVTIVDDDGLGIDGEINDTFLSVYPSIGNGNLEIHSSAKFNLHVFDVYGKEVRLFESLAGIQHLNLNDVTKGLYLLQFENGAQNVVKKVMIQ
jgi:hypothetical protein